MCEPRFRKIQGELLSEPSGVMLLDDGRYLIVNDTAPKKALFVLKKRRNGRLTANKLDFPKAPKLDDLEGVVGMNGHLYAISSHAEDKDKARRIVRFQVSENRVLGLKDARNSHLLKERAQLQLMAKYPALTDVDFAEGEFNIEGLARHGDELLIGLRGPLMDGSALILGVSGLTAAFDNGAGDYNVSEDSRTLNLGGGGIRAMSYIPDLNGFLIVGGRSVSGPKTFPCLRGSGMESKFLLWYWDGESCCKKVLCFDKSQGDIKIQPEGICPAVIGDKPTILVVSDDGSEKDGRQARYWLASLNEYKQLKAQI